MHHAFFTFLAPAARSTLTIVAAVALAVTSLGGCTVIAVADTVGTVAVKTVGLAADAAIGVVKISGKAVGAAADAVFAGDEVAK